MFEWKVEDCKLMNEPAAYKQADLEMAIFDDPVRMSDGNISHGDIIITGDDFYKITWKTDNNKGEKS